MRKLTSNAFVAEAAHVSMETPGGEGNGNTSFYWVSESKIIDNPYQYRMFYESEKMLELAENIHTLKNDLPTLGLEQVPFARLVRLVDGDYIPLGREEIATHEQILYWLRQDGVLVELMFGHRRRRAWTIIRHGMLNGCARLKMELSDEQRTRYFALAGDADYAVMPLHIGYADNQQMWKHAVSENRHRSDVTAIEEAEAMATAKTAFRYTDGQIGEIFGYARSTVANKMRLLELPEAVKDKMISGEISERAGRTVLALKDAPEKLAKALDGNEDSISSLEWAVKCSLREIENEKERLRQEQLMRDAGYRVVTKGAQVSTFDNYSNTHSDLLKQKRCGNGICPCFAVCHSNSQYSGEVVVDEQSAPNMVAACTDIGAATEKRRAQLDEETDKRKAKDEQARGKAEQQRVQTEQQWQAAIDNALQQTASKRLWQRPEFWRLFAHNIFCWQVTDKVAGGEWKSMDDLVVLLLNRMLDSSKEYKNGFAQYKEKDVADLIKRLTEASS